jgi:hypothetical protein
MKKVKVQELEEEKIYKFAFNGNLEDLSESIYKIDEQGNLYYKDPYAKDSFLKSTIFYNDVLNGCFVEIKREIDWTKVPRGTKVQVSLTENGDWFNRYFIDTDKEDGEYAFVTSLAMDDDFTGYEMEDYPEGWEYCRIHPTVQIPEKWYKEE